MKLVDSFQFQNVKPGQRIKMKPATNLVFDWIIIVLENWVPFQFIDFNTVIDNGQNQLISTR